MDNMIGYAVVWILMIVICGSIAKGRGRPVVHACILGAITGIIGVIILLILPSCNEQKHYGSSHPKKVIIYKYY